MPTDRLPPDWRERMVEMIRGAAPLDGSWFAGGPVLRPADQITVYRDQYRMRLGDAFLEEVPGWCALVDEQEQERVVAAYLAAHPSRTWTLNRVADAFADWLEQQGAPVVQVEMARLDRAVQRGFEAAEGRPLRPEDLATLPPLRLQPHVSLLRLTRDVHRARSAISSGAALPEISEGDFPLVVFRRGLRMRHWELPLGAWALLDGIARGLPVGAAIERAHAEGLVTDEDLSSRLSTWFSDFVTRDLVERPDPRRVVSSEPSARPAPHR